MSTQIEDMVSHGQDKKENLLLGLAGAIAGIILGAVLWIVIERVGFIAGIAGYAIVFLGMKGYEMLGGKLSKTGIVLCIILSLAAILGAEMFSLAIVVNSEWGVPMGDAFRLLPELLEEPDLLVMVIKDLAVGYALSIWASYSRVRKIWEETGSAN